MTASKRGYFRIIIRPRKQFVAFRTLGAEAPSSVQRLTNHQPMSIRPNQTWLLSKEIAHVEKGRIIPDTSEAVELLAAFGHQPVHQRDDLFKVM
jgi:hypothetical protein